MSKTKQGLASVLPVVSKKLSRLFAERQEPKFRTTTAVSWKISQVIEGRVMISDSLRKYIIDNFLFGQPDGFSDSTSFLESGVVSSTGVLELISYLESEFGISVQDEEIVPDNLDSIRQLTAFIEAKLATSALPAEPSN